MSATAQYQPYSTQYLPTFEELVEDFFLALVSFLDLVSFFSEPYTYIYITKIIIKWLQIISTTRIMN